MITLPRDVVFNVYHSRMTRPQFDVWIITNGTKQGKQGEDKLGKWIPVDRDFTVHFTGEGKNLNYIDDFLLDVRIKQAILMERKVGQEETKNWLVALYQGIKAAIELNPITEILDASPFLTQYRDLPGHSIELILAVTKWLGLQEDVNYWGTKYKEKEVNSKKIWVKMGRYDGRNKPVNAFYDYFIKGMTLQAIFKNHFSNY